MAVEDGAVLGVLLGALSKSEDPKSDVKSRSSRITSLLGLYESLRKSRTTLNVQGAVQNRQLYHIAEPRGKNERNKALKSVDWTNECVWNWGDIGYQRDLLGFDAVGDAKTAFKLWRSKDHGVEISGRLSQL